MPLHVVNRLAAVHGLPLVAVALDLDLRPNDHLLVVDGAMGEAKRRRVVVVRALEDPAQRLAAI